MKPFIVLLCAVLAGCGTSLPPSTAVVSTNTPAPAAVSPATLRPDGMARVVAPDGLHVWRQPSTKKADQLKNALPAGSLLYLASGPRVFNRVDWWEVQADYVAGRDSTFGWVIGTDGNDAATLAPVAPVCPSTTAAIRTDAIRTLGMLVTLSCLGNREIEMRGWVSCSEAAIDSMVGGPSWLGANWLCDIDSVVGLHGPLAGALLDGNTNPPIGHYAVRGHFDDPEAQTCSWIGFGVTVSSPVGPPDPGAVIICRQLFLVTSLTKVD